MRLLDENFKLIDEKLCGQLTKYPCERLDISAVAEHFYVNDEKINWKVTDYINLAPPFDRAWWEYKMPYQINFEGHLVHTSKMFAGRRIGVYEVSNRIGSLLGERLTPRMIGDMLNETMGQVRSPDNDPNIDVPMSHWTGFVPCFIVFRYLFMEMADGSPKLMVIHGDTVGPNGEASVSTAIHIAWDYEMEVDIIQAFDNFYHPYFYAESLLHCNNVSTEPSHSPRHIRRQIERTFKRKPLEFKQLTIDTSITKRRSKSGKSNFETLHARHLVRGHFKDYRDKGLFGKYKGVFWFAPHERGDESTQVQKEYIVK